MIELPLSQTLNVEPGPFRLPARKPKKVKMHSERGFADKSDAARLQWDNGGDFPILCEQCLGTTPYIRMMKDTYGGGCKMCDRPYTIYKWK